MDGWVTGLIGTLGYAGIALLMFLENLFPPIPSELIMPLAGFQAGKGELHLAGVIAAGLAGTVAGALFWYAVAARVGDARLKRWAEKHGRWITLSADEIARLEGWFARHRRWAVPGGHLIPGMRTLISIPAGVFGMGLPAFVGLTAIGAGLWTGALAVAGYALGQRFGAVEAWLGPASNAIMGAILIWYVYRVATFGRRS